MHTSMNTSNIGEHHLNPVETSTKMMPHQKSLASDQNQQQNKSVQLTSLNQLPDDDKELTFVQFLKHIQMFVQRDFTSESTSN